MKAFMRQDILGALFVSGVSGLTVLATYRPEKNESRIRIFIVLFLAMIFAFTLALILLFIYFEYACKPEANIINTPPDF